MVRNTRRFTVLAWSVTRCNQRLAHGSYVFMHESFEAATTDSKTRYAGKLATTFDLPELRIRTSDATRRET